MAEIKITIEAESLAKAITALAEAVKGINFGTADPDINKQEAVAPDPEPVEEAKEEPVQVEETLPFTEDPAPVQVTMDMVMSKCIELMDKGLQQKLSELLRKYGVQALPALKPEQLGAFYKDVAEVEA